MQTALEILKLTYVISYFALGIWWWVTWIGMHNNTIDGNTYKLINPFAVFDKNQFTEQGNSWRIKNLICDALLIILAIIYGIYNW